MRANSPHKFDLHSGYPSDVKSLFRNTLDVSPCGSTSYPSIALSRASKLLEINTLEERRKKNRRDRVDFFTKSLFRNILAVSLFSSIFYSSFVLSRARKFLEINILEKQCKKTREGH
jgi:hypothetical protein